MRGFLSRVRTGCELFTLFQVSVHSLSQGSILSPYSHGTVHMPNLGDNVGSFQGLLVKKGTNSPFFPKICSLALVTSVDFTRKLASAALLSSFIF